MARKSCELNEGDGCELTTLRDVMEYITADNRTQDEVDECLSLHKDLLNQGPGRIATSPEGIRGKGDVRPGKIQHFPRRRPR